MNQERREQLNEIRYLRITRDCIYEGVLLHKGDIIRINNAQLDDLVFNYPYDIVGINRYLSGIGYEYKLKPYPKGIPLDISKYLQMQPIIKIVNHTQLTVKISQDSYAYLSPELIRKFNDIDNPMCLWGPNIYGDEYEWYSTKQSIADSNREAIAELREKNGQLLILDFNAILRYFLPETTTMPSNEELATTEEELKIGTQLKPGIYTLNGDKEIYLKFHLKPGEEIDLSKPEYALMVLNQDFMKLLVCSEEITSLRKKSRLFKKECKDSLNRNSENTIIDKSVRYYRIKKNISLESIESLLNDSLESNLGDYNYKRVKKGNPYISISDRKNESIDVIRVEYNRDNLYSFVIDKELRKIAKPLSREESNHYRVLEISEEQKKREERAKKEYKGKNYYSTKLMADLAKTRVFELIRTGNISQEFRCEAREYCEMHKNEFKRFSNIFWDWSGSEKVFDREYEARKLVFYMMYKIISKSRDSRTIEREHQRVRKELRRKIKKYT